MADDHADVKRLRELADEMLLVYGLIRTVLSYLPLPIRLTSWDTGWSAPETLAALAAVNRARLELIPPQPLEERHMDLLQAATADWLIAYEFCSILVLLGDSGGWRLDGLAHLIRRAKSAAAIVEHDLGIVKE